jgi:hypothetical protein
VLRWLKTVVVGPVDVAVDAPVLEERVEALPVQVLVRRRPLKLSIQAFCHGDPGWMNTVSVP